MIKDYEKRIGNNIGDICRNGNRIFGTGGR